MSIAVKSFSVVAIIALCLLAYTFDIQVLGNIYSGAEADVSQSALMD